MCGPHQDLQAAPRCSGGSPSPLAWKHGRTTHIFAALQLPLTLAHTCTPPSNLQARNLARMGRKVAVIEAQNDLGGRTQRNFASTRDGKNITCTSTKQCPDGVWWYDR